MMRLNIKHACKPKEGKEGAKMQDVFLASEQDRAIFFAAIIRNEMPNKALTEAAKRYADELCKK